MLLLQPMSLTKVLYQVEVFLSNGTLMVSRCIQVHIPVWHPGEEGTEIPMGMGTFIDGESLLGDHTDWFFSRSI